MCVCVCVCMCVCVVVVVVVVDATVDWGPVREQHPRATLCLQEAFFIVIMYASDYSPNVIKTIIFVRFYFFIKKPIVIYTFSDGPLFLSRNPL